MPRDHDNMGPPVVPQGESETLLSPPGSGPYAPPAQGSAIRTPRGQAHRRTIFERMFEGRSKPYLRLGVYYVILITIMGLLVYFVPSVRDAFVESTLLPAREGGLMGAGPGTAQFGARLSLVEALHRLLTTFLVIAGALSLVVPVAWVYMVTKRFRYDPALVASVIILPIVVSGTALIVRNSLALAFSLAGIVAAVRFRNTLKDPRDAVYIFLVIACGLAAGVQALDVALAISVAFNFVVLTVWKYNIGSLYSGSFGRTGVLSVGDAALLVAETPAQQRAVRRRMLQYDTDLRTDGLMLVHSREPDMARTTVQEALADLAADWRLADVVPRGGEMHTLEYLVRLKKGVSPADLVGALDERWSVQVDAAEYLPFRTRRRKRKGRKG
ncbi:MAG TPA: DUF4956 domain-containing protein [Longimicrobium sp.]|nr:DUF4956 domain-containing protein [Longimicrobium sp.]